MAVADGQANTLMPCQRSAPANKKTNRKHGQVRAQRDDTPGDIGGEQEDKTRRFAFHIPQTVVNFHIPPK